MLPFIHCHEPLWNCPFDGPFPADEELDSLFVVGLQIMRQNIRMIRPLVTPCFHPHRFVNFRTAMGLMMEDDGKTMINPSIINHRMSSLTIYGTAVINDDQPGVGNCPILGILDIT